MLTCNPNAPHDCLRFELKYVTGSQSFKGLILYALFQSTFMSRQCKTGFHLFCNTRSCVATCVENKLDKGLA